MNRALRAAREKSGKTQVQVAEETGISQQVYQRYEYGKNAPGVRTAIRIADALGVVDLREIFPYLPEDDTTSYGGNQEK